MRSSRRRRVSLLAMTSTSDSASPSSDPHRWLEDLDAPRTRAWIDAQNERTHAYLRAAPRRDEIRARLEAVWSHERFGPPRVRGGRSFFARNDGLQDHDVVCWTSDPDLEPRVLIDPNGFDAESSLSLAGWVPSEDGTQVAYGVSSGGSDWEEWRVRDVATGSDEEDVVRWIKFSAVSWSRDGRGFYYGRYPVPEAGGELSDVNLDQRLFFHRVGTPQEEDVLVYERPDEPSWGFEGRETEDGAYLVVTAWEGTDRRTRVFYRPLGDSEPLRPLLVDFDAAYGFLGNDGPVFWFRTDAAAPRGRVIAVDVRDPRRTAWRTLVAESRDVLDFCVVAAERFVLGYLQDVSHRLSVRSLDGSVEGDIPLPGLGSIGSLTGRRSDDAVYVSYASFVHPSAVLRCDVASRTTSTLRVPGLKVDPDQFEVHQVWYESRDGTRVPMFVVHRRGLELDGRRPTWLYGYGGFNVSVLPAFSPSVLVWLEMGGVFAQPALRGGAEYGEEWHRAGMLERKQNVFDDFIAAGEWLVAHRYTSPARLAIGGASNGGLLVGACLTQRPDLFGACLPDVGVLDMLRFHEFTIGWAWIPEYGDPANPEHARFLAAYSPLHNLSPGTRYPATLVTTADHDDRVVPAHSYKFTAALQEAQAGDAPCLIRIETQVGHGAGTPTSRLIDQAVDRWAFLVRVFEM